MLSYASIVDDARDATRIPFAIKIAQIEIEMK